VVEGHAEDGREARGPGLELIARGELQDLRRTGLDRERVQVADEEVAVIADRGRDDVPLAGRDIGDARDRAARRTATMLYQVPSGSKSPGFGWATGWALMKADRSPTRVHDGALTSTR
jgi:hypothetical protein